jgi:octaprenyl-diphosphate synthase
LRDKNIRMSELDRIKRPIAKELEHFESYFREIMKSQIPFLNLILNYLWRRKGKQMRPMLVFLTAKLMGNPNQSTYTAAALIEIMHTATLVHDDVVDESFERRGFFSINAVWKSKVAVLLGDYLLAKGLLLAVQNKEYDLLNLVTDAVKEMSEGELQQIRNSRKLRISQDEYYEIIRKKTATLISCCSSCGAKSVGVTAETVIQMKEFGELLGIAFQIKDDLLDYQLNSITGKPVGNDLKDKKLTLPLIYALESSTTTEKDRIIRLMNSKHSNNSKLLEVLKFIEAHKGLEYARSKMNEYSQRALQKLESFPESEVKTALSAFVDYTISRNK